MKFTGERMMPEYNSEDEIYLEHITRYIFASQFVKGKSVLDIACGSGYGCDFILKAGAKNVIGVDISEETILYCKEKYRNDSISFQIGGVENIPIKDGEIDVIVSMETIEHVDEQAQRKFLSEVKRILAPGGIFIVSTPNSLVYPKGNPFHIKELSPDNFQLLLDENFKKTEIFYQDNIESSFVFSAENLKSEDLSSQSNMQARNTRKIDPMECLYLVAVCSDNMQVQKKEEFAVIFKKKIRDFYSDIAEKEQIIRKQEEELKKKADSCKYEIEEAMIESRKKIEELKKELHHVKSSKFWKIREKYCKLLDDIKKKNKHD
jgi:O-antigen biosynthesis protein